MDLNIHNIIKGPHVTDKAHLMNKKQNKLVLEVHLAATKSDIKLAVQQLFNVKVEKIGTLISKKKKAKGLNRRKRISTPSIRKTKIAYVSLAEGYKLNLFEQAAMPVAETRE
jgi:large subunit ribosomal protein L23